MFKRGNKGITLIALIITIIVLLILAGVTIAQITGQDSAPQKAAEAKLENEKGAMKDTANLLATRYIQEYYEEKYVKSTPDFNYANQGAYAEAQFPVATEGGYTYSISGHTLTVTDAKGNTVTGTINDNGTITWDETSSGETQSGNEGGPTVIGGIESIKRWDKVNYDPGTLTTASIKLPEGVEIEKTKLASLNLPEGASINGAIDASKATDWVVLDVTDNGDILIIPTNYDTTKLQFNKSISTFNNSVETLDIVASIYKNPSYAKESRSIRIDDLERALNVKGYSNNIIKVVENGRLDIDSNNRIIDRGIGNKEEREYEVVIPTNDGIYSDFDNWPCLGRIPIGMPESLKSEYFLATRVIDRVNFGSYYVYYAGLPKIYVDTSNGYSKHYGDLHIKSFSSNWMQLGNHLDDPLDFSGETASGNVLPVVYLKSGIQMKKIDGIWELAEKFDEPDPEVNASSSSSSEIDTSTSSSSEM